MRRINLMIALVLAASSSAPVLAQQPGDTVVATCLTQIKIGGNVLQTLSPGQYVTVYAVQGDWLWVSRESTGWISKADVEMPLKAVELFSVKIGQDPC
ncbi:MAG TPA: hypothetical protein VGM05_14315, partial [Planctomycetaceae bacterium]